MKFSSAPPKKKTKAKKIGKHKQKIKQKRKQYFMYQRTPNPYDINYDNGK